MRAVFLALASLLVAVCGDQTETPPYAGAYVCTGANILDTVESVNGLDPEAGNPADERCGVKVLRSKVFCFIPKHATDIFGEII